jgi:hypothetical protein
MQPYLAYMVNKTLPKDVVEARRIVRRFKSFCRIVREAVQEKYNRCLATMRHPSRRANYTKGYPCMSWYFEDSSHRDGLSEGLVGEQRRVRLETGQVTAQHLPMFRPSSPEVKPLHHALVFIINTRWLAVLLELCCLEQEEEGFDPPTLRVQAPLYRQGPGYSMSSGCPAASSPVAAALAWVPHSSDPLPGRRLLYKVPFPLDRHIWGICPWLASDPFVERGSTWCGWWRLCVAGVTPFSSLCRSCRAPATFNKAMVKGFVVFAGLNLRRGRSQLAAGAACSSVKAGLVGRMSRRSLGCQPAGCSAFGLPR